jgi:hypothetical protein
VGIKLTSLQPPTSSALEAHNRFLHYLLELQVVGKKQYLERRFEVYPTKTKTIKNGFLVPSIFMVVIHMAKFHASIMSHAYFNIYESKKMQKQILYLNNMKPK